MQWCYHTLAHVLEDGGMLCMHAPIPSEVAVASYAMYLHMHSYLCGPSIPLLLVLPLLAP